MKLINPFGYQRGASMAITKLRLSSSISIKDDEQPDALKISFGLSRCPDGKVVTIGFPGQESFCSSQCQIHTAKPCFFPIQPPTSQPIPMILLCITYSFSSSILFPLPYTLCPGDSGIAVLSLSKPLPQSTLPVFWLPIPHRSCRWILPCALAYWLLYSVCLRPFHSLRVWTQYFWRPSCLRRLKGLP